MNSMNLAVRRNSTNVNRSTIDKKPCKRAVVKDILVERIKQASKSPEFDRIMKEGIASLDVFGKQKK